MYEYWLILYVLGTSIYTRRKNNITPPPPTKKKKNTKTFESRQATDLKYKNTAGGIWTTQNTPEQNTEMSQIGKNLQAPRL